MSEGEKISKIKKLTTSTKYSLRQLISGGFIISTIQKHIKYIIFVFLLAFAYIGYKYAIENTVINNKKLDAEIKSLHAEYVTKSMELMRISKRSEILEQVQNRKLSVHEPENPPQRIKITK